jgi:hypothetical protein
MKNYYKILNIDINSSKTDIQLSYNNRIKQFNNLPFLTNEMKEIIKNLKEAKYILLDEERREKYNNYLFDKDDSIIKKPIIEEPIIKEPIIEEPIIEEPIIEEPIIEEPISYRNNTIVNQRIMPKLKDNSDLDNTKICDRIFSFNVPSNINI